MSYGVQAGNWSYVVEDDCSTNYWAIVTGTVTDEILGNMFAPGLNVDTKRPDLPSKVTPNGLFAITGYPQQSFPVSATLTLYFNAPGFHGSQLKVSVPAGGPFPVVAGTVVLRRLPVRIQGRVVNANTRAPLPNALVLAVDDPNTPPVVHTTAVRSPLYFDHLNGVSVQNVTIAVTGSPSLQADTVAGTQVIELNSRTGLAAGSIVQLSKSSKTIVEYGVVDHLGPGPAASGGQVFFRNALNRSYAMASTVQVVTATPAGGAATLKGAASAGDGVVVASVLLNGTTLVVDPGSLNEEYHEVGALSDADGYYGLDGMGRVQEIFLQAAQGGLQQTAGWFIEYDQPINLLDFRLS